MANFSAKILGSAVSSLSAQQAIIANTASNISNVNTEGYARRVLELRTAITPNTAGLSLGSGVQVGDLQRVADQFLNALVRDSISDAEAFAVEDEFLDRVQQVFDLTGSTDTVGFALTDFFDSLNNLSVDPANIPLRTDVIEKTNNLVDAIQTTFNSIARLQDEADQRISVEINTINSITTSIAELNGRIQQRESGGSTAADERDQRQLLIDQLAEKIGFNMIENSNGGVLITLEGGFPLVNGTTSRNLEVTNNPSFNPGIMPPSLSGGVLNHIVFDYDPSGGAAHLDLTQILQRGGGSVGGLLGIRGYNDPANTSSFQADGALVDLASRVEAITQSLLTTFNDEYLGPVDRNTGNAVWDPSSFDLDGNSPGVYGFFTFTGAMDANANGLPDDLAALGIDNFSSLLSAAITDPRAIAAAVDDNTGNPPPAAVFAQGDGRNLYYANNPNIVGNPDTGLSTIQSRTLTLAAGSYSFTGTLSDSYDTAVGVMGNYKNRSLVNANVSRDNLTTALAQRDEFQGVSLEEEFTQLIKFQKAFEASARMIRTADELMDVLVSLI